MRTLKIISIDYVPCSSQTNLGLESTESACLQCSSSSIIEKDLLSSSLDNLPCRSQAQLDLTADNVRSRSQSYCDLQSSSMHDLSSAIDKVPSSVPKSDHLQSSVDNAASTTQTDVPLQFSTVSSIKIDHLRLSKVSVPSRSQLNQKPRTKRDQLTSSKDKVPCNSQTDPPLQFSASASSEEKRRKMLLYRQLLKQQISRGEAGPLKNAAAKLWQSRQQQHKGLQEYLRQQKRAQMSAMSSLRLPLQP